MSSSQSPEQEKAELFYYREEKKTLRSPCCPGASPAVSPRPHPEGAARSPSALGLQAAGGALSARRSELGAPAASGGCRAAAFESADSQPGAIGPRIPASNLRAPRRGEPRGPGRALRGRGAAGRGRDSVPATPVGSARPPGSARLASPLPSPHPPLGRGRSPSHGCRPPGRGEDRTPSGGSARSWPRPRGQRPEPSGARGPGRAAEPAMPRRPGARTAAAAQ